MKKFLIIDGNSILNRAFYGVNARMSSKTAGIHTNAIYGFLNVYWMILEKLKPDYVAVTFDLKAPTFRHKMYPEYKATRKGMPNELSEQMPVMKEVLNAMNIPIIEHEGYEADDILGTVSKLNEGKNIFTYVLTGDRDALQLISNKTSIVIPSTKAGKTEYSIYTPELLMEKKNIEPYQVVHVKALMGDSSDNIPGVRGIGEKTAYSLIEKYTTLNNVYAFLKKDTLDVSPKTKEKLAEDEEMARLSFKLGLIDREVPIDIDYNACKFSDVNKEKLYRLFKKLEFVKFMSRYDFSGVEDINENIDIEKEDSFNLPEVCVLDSAAIKSSIEKIENILKEEKVSYILNIKEDSANINRLSLATNFFGIYSNAEDKVYILDSSAVSSKEFDSILKSFITSASQKLGFDIKQDIRYFFKRYGDSVKINGFTYDLLIAFYLLDSTRSKFTAETILSEMFDVEFDIKKEDKKEKQISLFDNIDNDENKDKLSNEDITNICKYLKGIYMSYNVIEDKLKSEGMSTLFSDIEMPLVETLASMENSGMYIDKEKLEIYDKEITENLRKVEDEIYELAGEKFNVGSPQQLGRILFEKLGLEHKRKTKTGYSTDKSVLEGLQGKHEIIDKVLYFRQLAKLKSTYVDGMKDKISKESRIHTTFMQTVTTTGRLSSVEPNLQNIPVRLELGRKIRSFFSASGKNVIVDADYSQIELRVMAHISDDKVMIDAFNKGIDIHTVTASQVFGVPIEEVTKEMRTKAKAVNFGIIYGISSFGLSQNINCSRMEAKMYIDNYLEKYSGIRNFMENIVEDARKDGYVTTMFGRRRYIPEINDRNKNIALFGERVAMNTPIQGTAADIIKIAMNKVYQKLKENNMKSKLVMQVHDELIIEAVPSELDKVKEILKGSMQNVTHLKVPLDTELNVGKTWYDAK